MAYESRKARNKPYYILSVFGAIATVYLAIVIAPYSEKGLIGILMNMEAIPWLRPEWTESTPKVILVCLAIYAVALIIAWSYRKRYHRQGVEHGSSDWADLQKLRKEFHSDSPKRVVYTDNFAISFDKDDLYKHKRNFNTLIVGGPGSGKTRGHVYPNILEATSSCLVIDPAGEVCRNTAKYMKEKKGFKVKVLNITNPEMSCGYNPFHYIRSDNRADDDVQRIVTAIFQATTPPNSQTQDPFWDEAGKMLLSSLMYLLHYFGATDEKNFPYLMNLIRAGKIEDADNKSQSALDLLFESIEHKYPDHICVRYYKNATSGAGKTLQSVQITLLSRLQKFEISSIADMMKTDELELDKMGDEPTILYCIIPDNDSSYNFIISILYIQLFLVLYDRADNYYHGPLPNFVHVIMDEFANVHTPEDFLHILGTCRKRNIGISIYLQNLAQLKAKYKEGWENIIGQCDEFLYLGGNESSTHEYISKMLGKETIDTNTYGRRYGAHGDASTNYQIGGRELLTPDEIRMLDYNKAILIVKNALPLIDNKIDILKYKGIKDTAIGGNKAMEYYPEARNPKNSSDNQADPISPEEAEYKRTVKDNDGAFIPELLFQIDGLNLPTDEELGQTIEQTSYIVDYEELMRYMAECNA